MKESYRNDCPDYLQEFLVNMKVIKDRADRTEEAYYIDLRTFLRYLKVQDGLIDKNAEWTTIEIKDTPIELVKKFKLNDAYMYLRYLKDERNNSTATRARKTSALKQFYIYLHKRAGLIAENPLVDLEMPRIKNKLPKYLTLDECLNLLKDINQESKNYQRDYCIICLFLNCGMRLSELVGINIQDFSFENKTLRLFGKGSKERIVYLNSACVAALRDYLVVRIPVTTKTEGDKNALFLSSNKTRISKRRVQQVVEENLQRAGLSNIGITTHKLRHTAATLMYQNGVDTLVLRDLLGHKSIATTKIYTHLTNESLKQAADSSPLADISKDKKNGK